jgi:hypothetical protein
MVRPKIQMTLAEFHFQIAQHGIQSGYYELPRRKGMQQRNKKGKYFYLPFFSLCDSSLGQNVEL